jgi:tetratricopeptide (TPR) repeat protein
VSELLEREIPDAPELTGKGYQDRIVLTLVDLLRNARQPIVLLLEDLQWSGESLLPLKQILLVKDQLPTLMIVASYRSDEAPVLPDELAGMTPIKLERLDETAVQNLCVSMLGEPGKRDELVQTIQRNSEGNTFFIIETVRAMAEEHGSLEKVTTAELPQVVFTGSMRELMRRRLSQVGAQYTEIQTLAAVIGREIDTQLLKHAFDADRLQLWLANASDYGVIEVKGNAWRFAHDKLRETLIADIPSDTLPTLHRTAAETIETVYLDDAGYNEALLAHWQAVGDLDKTYEYLLPVARNMIEIAGTYSIAEAHLHQMLGRLPEGDGRCIALWNWLADSTARQGNYSASQGYALQAQELATSLDDREGLAKSVKNLADVAMDQADYARATDLYQQSLGIFRKLGDLRGTANSLSNLGIVAAYQGNYHLAADRLQQSLAIREELGDQRGISISLTNLGVIAQQQQDYDRAADLLQQSLGIHQHIGDQSSIATSLNNLGLIANGRGNYDRASDLLQQSLATFQQLGKKFDTVDSLIELGRVALNQGDMQVASGRFSKALHIAKQIALPTLFMRSVLGLAVILLHRRQMERAAQLAGLAMHHPTFDTDVGRSLDDLLPKLKAALPPDELQAALERGKSLDLDTVVRELLAEFGDDNELPI